MKLLRFRHLMAGLGVAALLAACGGGGGGGDGGEPVTPPKAVATANPTTLEIGGTVTLDGSASNSPRQGATLQYQWTLVSQPVGSNVQIANAQSATASFVPDRGGRYEANLQVSDGTASDNARVAVTVTNPNPVAVITPETQSVLVGATVTLDGSASQPPTGQDASALRYAWELTEQPAGEPHVLLQNANSARAMFVAEKQGAYKATLRVSHGERQSVPVETSVLVGVTNSAPVIKLNYPAQAKRGDRIVLDGSATSDPDGDKLSFRWRIPDFIPNSGTPPIPRASRAVLENANTHTASFVADVAGRYHIDFTVYDDSVAVTEQVVIDVAPNPDMPNQPPVAVLKNTECELGGYCNISGSSSYDPDGDPLTYKWTYWHEDSPDDPQTSEGPLPLVGLPR